MPLPCTIRFGVLVLVATACGSSAGTDLVADAPDVPATDTADDPGPAPEPSKMMLAAGVQDVGGGTTITNALFFNAKVNRGEPGSVDADGPCQFVDFRPPDGTLPQGRNAGTVTVGVVGDAAKTLTLEPDANGVYFPVYQAKALWADGDSIAFGGAGGADVQPFLTPLALPPVPGEIGWPAAETVGGTPAIPVTRGEPFTATWTAAAGKVMILLAQSPVLASTWFLDLQVICIFDGAAGTGTVPATITSKFAVSDASTSTLVGVAGIATENLMPGLVAVQAGLFHGVAKTGVVH